MRRVVEISQSPARPPLPPGKKIEKPKAKPPEKVKLPKETIEEIIEALENAIKRTERFEKKYKHISEKYNEDLEQFIKREGDNLPEWDWGKKVLACCKKRREQIRKLKFYNKLLIMYEQQHKKE